MKKINSITCKNFNKSFNLIDVLTDSAFYPACGIDATDIECLTPITNSFVHVDYSTPRDVVENGMKHHFESVGFDLIGIKDITQNELAPNGFDRSNFKLNQHEKNRLKTSFINDRFYCKNFTPFALWAVYELNHNKTNKIDNKLPRFSLLFIGGEACATVEAIYVGNKINPLVITIINSGEGFGDNWTIFRDPDFRLYQSLLKNHKLNNVKMPDYLLTNSQTPDEPCFWSEYSFKQKIYSNGWQYLFKIKN